MKDKAEIELLVPFKRLPTVDMNLEQGKTLLMLISMGGIRAENAYKDMLQDDAAWKERAIDLRVKECLGLNVSCALKFFIAYYCADKGFSMPLCIYYYLKLWNREKQAKEITLKMFCEQIFKMGLPSIEDVNKLWDKTKVDSTPILDIPQYCESIY